MAARECLRWPPRRTHIASTRQPCQGAPLRSITFPSKQQHGRSEQSWQGLLINSVITRNHPHLAYHHHHSMFMISKDVNGVGGVLSVRIKKDLQQQQRQQQQRWSRCGLQPSHHHSHRQHNNNKDENYSYDQYNDDHNHHCHCPRKNFNGTPIASAVTEGRRREVCPFPFCGGSNSFFPFLSICSNPFSLFWGGCSNPFSLVLLIAQQDLNQEARGGNLFNEDEEDIERYIDDDDDDFVDNVRFQDEQVDPKTRHISWIEFSPCKDLSRVGLADSPGGSYPGPGVAGGNGGSGGCGDIWGSGGGVGAALTSSAYYRRMRLHTASTLDLPVSITQTFDKSEKNWFESNNLFAARTRGRTPWPSISLSTPTPSYQKGEKHSAFTP